MTRIGSCLQCGKCCIFLAFPLPLDDLASPIVQEFYAARGLTITDGMVEVPHICPHLTADRKCDLDGDSKPQTCRESPYSDLVKPAGCGFTFTDGSTGG